MQTEMTPFIFVLGVLLPALFFLTASGIIYYKFYILHERKNKKSN